jgi:hypothetical protein
MDEFLPFSQEGQGTAAERFARLLKDTIIQKACGAEGALAKDKPSDRVWLGRVAPALLAAASGRDSRLERMEPCAIGFRIRPAGAPPWRMSCRASLFLWRRQDDKSWSKIGPIKAEFDVETHVSAPTRSMGHDHFAKEFAALGAKGLSAEVQLATESTNDGGATLTITLVNTSDEEDAVRPFDPRFYEAKLSVTDIATAPFLLDSLEDSFRHDRRVPAYGINCGVRGLENGFVTTDAPSFEKNRPVFWGSEEPAPELTFAELANDPVRHGSQLLECLERWGQRVWNPEVITRRASVDGWSAAMTEGARTAASEFWAEVGRVRRGVDLIRTDTMVGTSFRLMNEAMAELATRKNYTGWRPFQLGFLLANLISVSGDHEDRKIVDIVWFATGGGKTETYLGLLVAAAFYDRLRGKLAGVTAWSRFPLRLLSLQQMQRFADAIASAEIVRRRHGLGGTPFSVGFLVGDGATPNRVRRPEQNEQSRYDPDDPTFPGRFRMLRQCPFCGNTDLKMKFDTATWTLQHRCGRTECRWPEKALPFYIVDEEVFRFLPTVVVGTLDKAASIGLQQAMRGMVGAPRGCCSRPGHGFTYNLSGKSPNGCLVPDCKDTIDPLPFDSHLFGPTFRLQDELHLLRDSLGAVDGHYEAVLDGIQLEITGQRPKILASSATLSGYVKQSDVLYRRTARVFPQPGPSPKEGFWSIPSKDLMRLFAAIAPRGATIEFAVDRLVSELQIVVRDLVKNPVPICTKLNIDERYAAFLINQYGTTVVYGNTLRDLDAVTRSSATQLVGVEGPVNTVSLTGRTQFEHVAQTLDALQGEDERRPFEERIHLITASSMMSHGVDVDRLNVMIVLGLPLTAAEFIQATARVGRRWPGLVLVVHKMGRERDASVFRSFEKFVEQGDRFVEPIPITRRSRRVLERTVSGLEMSRLLHVHAPSFAGRFTTVQAVRHSLEVGEIDPALEQEAITRYLQLDPVTEEEHIKDIRDDLDRYFDKIAAPTVPHYTWFGKVWTKKPMTSLRDVEEQAPVHLMRDS